MKQKFLLICLMLSAMGFSSFAQNSKVSEPFSKTVKLKEECTSLVIEDNLSVILTESASNNITIVGDIRDVKKTGVSITDGRLVLSYALRDLPSEVKVYVPAALLGKVFINGKGTLSSSTVLKNKTLKIFLAEEGKVNNRSLGNVIVEPMNDICFVSTL